MLTLYHRQIAEWVTGHFVDTADWKPHRRLAEFFTKQPYFLEFSENQRAESKKPLSQFSFPANIRKADELPWQFTRAQQWSDAERCLCDIRFIEAKCWAQLVFDLAEDCERLRKVHPTDAMSEILAAYHAILGVVSTRPEYAMQLMHNHLTWAQSQQSLILETAQIARRDLDARPFWIRAAARLTARAGGTLGDPTRLQALSGDFLALVTRDNVVRVLKLPYGQCVESRHISASDEIVGVSLSGQAGRIAVVTKSGYIHLPETGIVLQGREGETSTAWLSDTIVGVRHDDALVEWDTEGNEVATLTENLPAPLIVLKIDSKRQRLLYLGGYSSQVLGIAEKQKGGSWTTTLVTNSGVRVTNASFEGSGEFILTAAQDRRLRLIDLAEATVKKEVAWEARQEPSQLRGRALNCCTGFDGTNTTAFVVLEGGQLFSWDWEKDRIREIANYGGVHSSDRPCLFDVLDERRLILSFDDRYEIVSATDTIKQCAQQHTGSVSSVAVLPPDRIASVSQHDRRLCWYRTNGLEFESAELYFDLPPTTVLATRSPDYVFVATRNGCLWKNRRNVRVSGNAIDRLFDREIVSASVISEDVAIAAAESGEVRQINVATEEQQVLAYATPDRRQLKVLSRAGGGYWSLYQDNRKARTFLAIAGHSNRETIIRQWQSVITDISLAPSGHQLVAAGQSVEVGKFINGEWIWNLRRNEPVCFATFVDNECLLAVIKKDRWLELWSIENELATVGGHPLAEDAACMDARRNVIAIGLKSGQLLAFQVCGTALLPAPTPKEEMQSEALFKNS